jgi:hypothetical protein
LDEVLFDFEAVLLAFELLEAVLLPEDLVEFDFFEVLFDFDLVLLDPEVLFFLVDDLLEDLVFVAIDS